MPRWALVTEVRTASQKPHEPSSRGTFSIGWLSNSIQIPATVPPNLLQWYEWACHFYFSKPFHWFSCLIKRKSKSLKGDWSVPCLSLSWASFQYHHPLTAHQTGLLPVTKHSNFFPALVPLPEQPPLLEYFVSALRLTLTWLHLANSLLSFRF